MSGKGTEEALWGGEEMFRSLVQSSCDVITILDTDGTIIHDGPAVERVLGYKPEERIDTSIFDEAHPDNLERGTRAFGKVLAAPRGASCPGVAMAAQKRLPTMLPDDFLPTAREMGLIIPIDGWVMKEACRQAREWQERYPSEPPLSVGVNLSAGQVRNLRPPPGAGTCASGKRT